MKVCTRIFIISLFLLGLLGLNTRPVSAQDESPLIVDVDRTKLGDNETLTLKVTVRLDSVNLNSPQPELPSLDDFNVISSGTSSQISINNSVMSTSKVYTYYLQPLHSGELEIGSISLTISGETYQSEPITITVYDSGTQPEGSDTSQQGPEELAGQRFFIESEVDKTDPYIGEPVLFTFRFYQAVELYEQPSYSPPEFNGFWVEKLDTQNQYTTQIGGYTYRITEVQSLLFPNKAGSLEIGPAYLSIPGSVFQSGQDLSTDSISLDVKPLPDGAPQRFNGAVGQYTLSVSADTLETKVNEALTITVTLSGTGNLNNLPDPEWPEIENMRFYESQAETNTRIENGQLSGSLVYERLLVPLESGEYEFPALSYVYFNPQSGQYETTTSPALTFQVAEGDTQAAVTNTVQNNNQKEDVELLASDIRYLKPAPASLSTENTSAAGSKLYWLGWALPLLLVGTNFLWQRREDLQKRDPARFHYTRAYRQARKALTAARKSEQIDLDAAHILHDYLSAKLGQKTGGMTHQALAEALQAKDLPDEVQKETLNFLQECEIHRFAPRRDEDAAGQFLQKAQRLVEALERSL